MATGSDRCSGNSPPTKKYDEADFGKFLELLPPGSTAATLRHVVEVRHDSFRVPGLSCEAFARASGSRWYIPSTPTYPAIADVTADFVYARLQKGQDKLSAGYPPKALDAWAVRAKKWAAGGAAGRPALRL